MLVTGSRAGGRAGMAQGGGTGEGGRKGGRQDLTERRVQGGGAGRTGILPDVRPAVLSHPPPPQPETFL